MFWRILQIAIPFVWFGFVCAISFMEAPLKFTAPNITIPLGLGIGFIVFHSLNKVELVFGGLLLISYFFSKPKSKISVGLYGIIVLILLAQTFVLFPLLDERTMKVIAGDAEPYSNLHIVYIVFDSIKVLLLLGMGVSLTWSNLIYERH
jgi:hypothetical protein